MLHFRLVVPSQEADRLMDELLEDGAITNLVLIREAALEPSGDLLLFDVAREAASRLLDRLRELRIDDFGSVTIQAIEATFSRSAQESERAVPGFAVDAVVWQEIDQYASEQATLSFTYLAFLAIATQLAAIGVVIDSAILIVGAMVLGPEFGPVASICIGLYRRDIRRGVVALRTLLVGFLVAIAITCLCALISRPLGLITPASLGHQVLTGFIVHPNIWGFIVAVLAGAAGMLSLTTARSMSLVGVFISVTTVPAAGNAAVALALADWRELTGSLEQLGLNIVGMVAAGTLTLVLLRYGWSLVPESTRRTARHRLARRRSALR
ncbi:MAG: DUF389 domain-containing protein [Candidatus Dormibacteraeota bacterium]|nr:DUF389 domain-containing protein [Candidatus Dormibacteraeota bacterium]